MRTPKPWASRKPAAPATGRPAARSSDPGAEDVGGPVAALYAEHYRPLVRLAALLVADPATAEEIVQEAFADVHGTWRTLPGQDAALRYLRRSLLRRSRAVTPQQADPGAGLLAALRALPARQREVLVLRYFADLPEAEIAAVTGTRLALVRTYAARGMSSLRAGLPGNVA